MDGFFSVFSGFVAVVAGIFGFYAWVMLVFTAVFHPKIPFKLTFALSCAGVIATYLLGMDDYVSKLLFYTCLTIFSSSFIMLSIAYWKSHG